MAKNEMWLEARYGKLAVIDQFTADGRTMARVRCDCGVRKVVAGASLRSGNTRSCGSTVCSGLRKRARTDCTYRPRPSKVWSLNEARTMWTMFNAGKSYAYIADLLRVRKHVVVNCVRCVGRAGGIDTYVERVSAAAKPKVKK